MQLLRLRGQQLCRFASRRTDEYFCACCCLVGSKERKATDTEENGSLSSQVLAIDSKRGSQVGLTASKTPDRVEGRYGMVGSTIRRRKAGI